MKWNLEHSYLKLPRSFYSQQIPTAVSEPSLIVFNQALSDDLGLGSFDPVNDLSILAGNKIVSDSTPIAQAYSGHQFGHFNRLGDGRAILLGEHVTDSKSRFDIQLKGSGPTPYSRRGDGRAALGPMLREYLISEAMHSLGVPTTRSLAVVSTGEKVLRDEELKGAVLTRVAASHIRVGTFQYAASLNDYNAIESLANYAIHRHYPELFARSDLYKNFLIAVCDKQAKLLAQWMHLGFIHGVMNTDNMSICGETIDYGPCAFMNAYDPDTVFSSIDQNGRYAFGQQPSIAKWNLARFAETLLPLLDSDFEKAKVIAIEAIESFSNQFEKYWLAVMHKKLGFKKSSFNSIALIEEILGLMYTNKADYTVTFRALSLKELPDSIFFKQPQVLEWHKKWLETVLEDGTALSLTKESMEQINPHTIPRNAYVENALSLATNTNDFTEFHSLLKALQSPFSAESETRYSIIPEFDDKSYRTFCGT